MNAAIRVVSQPRVTCVQCSICYTRVVYASEQMLSIDVAVKVDSSHMTVVPVTKRFMSQFQRGHLFV